MDAIPGDVMIHRGKAETPASTNSIREGEHRKPAWVRGGFREGQGGLSLSGRLPGNSGCRPQHEGEGKAGHQQPGCPSVPGLHSGFNHRSHLNLWQEKARRYVGGKPDPACPGFAGLNMMVILGY